MIGVPNEFIYSPRRIMKKYISEKNGDKKSK